MQFFTRKDGWIELGDDKFPANPTSGDTTKIDNLELTYDHPGYHVPKTWVITKEN